MIENNVNHLKIFTGYLLCETKTKRIFRPSSNSDGSSYKGILFVYFDALRCSVFPYINFDLVVRALANSLNVQAELHYWKSSI